MTTSVKIGDRYVGDNHPCFTIAEIGKLINPYVLHYPLTKDEELVALDAKINFEAGRTHEMHVIANAAIVGGLDMLYAFNNPNAFDEVVVLRDGKVDAVNCRRQDQQQGANSNYRSSRQHGFRLTKGFIDTLYTNSSIIPVFSGVNTWTVWSRVDSLPKLARGLQE